MGLLDTEAGKRRLLCVEIPAVERYNEGRDPDFKVQVVRGGSALTLRYRLLSPDGALAADLREDRVDVGVFLMLSELAARSCGP